MLPIQHPKHASYFVLLGTACGYFAWGLLPTWGAGSLVLLWPAASLTMTGVAYAGAFPRLMGKVETTGRFAWWSAVLHAPFGLLLRLTWHLQCLLQPGPAAHEVAPGIWLGRWPRADDLPPNTHLVVDLTAELPIRPGVLIPGRLYRCLPTLDATPPPAEGLHRLAKEVAPHPGPVYIHCAAGRSRSATLAAAVLVHRGLAQNASEAIAILRRARPRVRLTRHQHDVLEQVLALPDSVVSSTTDRATELQPN